MSEVHSDWTGQVMTVRGPVAPDQLGVTLSHDHLIVDGWGLRKLYDTILDDESVAIEEAKLFAAAGGGTICEPTNIGLGRDPEALRRISRAANINVVMGTGWYREMVYPL